jgi:uncharacterized protein YfiM (DUF2279 family)
VAGKGSYSARAGMSELLKGVSILCHYFVWDVASSPSFKTSTHKFRMLGIKQQTLSLQYGSTKTRVQLFVRASIPGAAVHEYNCNQNMVRSRKGRARLLLSSTFNQKRAEGFSAAVESSSKWRTVSALLDNPQSPHMT